VLPDDLPEVVRTAGAVESEASRREAQDKSQLPTLEEMEKQYLMRVLREVGGNKVKAARVLGIDRRTLYRMAERFGVPLDEEGEG
jgi:DNA-binding NtrC family response regulator